MLNKDQVIEALKTVMDPDIYIDIWTLGLIYDIAIDASEEDSKVDVRMTLTSPACPSGPYLVEEVRDKVSKLEGTPTVNVEVVFQPPWEPSEELKALLGI